MSNEFDPNRDPFEDFKPIGDMRGDRTKAVPKSLMIWLVIGGIALGCMAGPATLFLIGARDHRYNQRRPISSRREPYLDRFIKTKEDARRAMKYSAAIGAAVGGIAGAGCAIALAFSGKRED